MAAWIFDCDGVILDSVDFWNHMVQNYLQEKGCTPDEKLVHQLSAMNYEEGCRYLAKQYPLQRTWQEVREECDNKLKNYYWEEVKEKGGIRQVLEEISKGREKMVIVTSTPKDFVEHALQRLELADYAEEILSATDLSLSKDEGEIYDRALNILGVEAEETFCVEDSLYALKKAKALGFQTIGIYEKEHSEDWEEIQRISDYCFKNIEEMRREIE